MTDVPWRRLSVALSVVAAVMLAATLRLVGDCSVSDARDVAIGAMLLGSGAAVTLAAAFFVLGWLGRPTLASGVGVLAGVAFGASFFLYALVTDLGDCPS